MSEKNYITPKGFSKLQSELEYLLKTERPEVTKTVAWAASNGDRSENADYQYGKKRLREIDRRLRFLTTRLDKAVVVDPLNNKGKDIVQFGAQVTIVNIDDDCDEEVDHKIYTIVGVDEIKTEIGLISWRSPIGSALIGKKVGDEVKIRSPKGEYFFEIIKIEYNEIFEVGEPSED